MKWRICATFMRLTRGFDLSCPIINGTTWWRGEGKFPPPPTGWEGWEHFGHSWKQPQCGEDTSKGGCLEINSWKTFVGGRNFTLLQTIYGLQTSRKEDKGSVAISEVTSASLRRRERFMRFRKSPADSMMWPVTLEGTESFCSSGEQQQTRCPDYRSVLFRTAVRICTLTKENTLT